MVPSEKKPVGPLLQQVGDCYLHRPCIREVVIGVKEVDKDALGPLLPLIHCIPDAMVGFRDGCAPTLLHVLTNHFEGAVRGGIVNNDYLEVTKGLLRGPSETTVGKAGAAPGNDDD